MVTRDCGQGRMGNYCLMGMRFQFGMMKNLEMDGGIGYTTGMYLMTKNCILKNG